MTRMVQFTDVVARVNELEAFVSSLAPPTPSTPVAGGDFARALASATATSAPLTATAPTATSAPSGSAVSIAEGEIGQAEQPPGSNDGPRIADYRSAVAGAQAGQPWCAYFVSWVEAQAGTPIGDNGSGLGSVAAIASWAQRTGRYLPAGSTPQAGDLILFGDRHVGLVESVNADGSLTTIEGNEGDRVSRVHRLPSEATGFVRP